MSCVSKVLPIRAVSRAILALVIRLLAVVRGLLALVPRLRAVPTGLLAKVNSWYPVDHLLLSEDCVTSVSLLIKQTAPY